MGLGESFRGGGGEESQGQNLAQRGVGVRCGRKTGPSLEDIRILRSPSSSPGCSQPWASLPPFVWFVFANAAVKAWRDYLSKAKQPLNGDGKLDQRALASPCPFFRVMEPLTCVGLSSLRLSAPGGSGLCLTLSNPPHARPDLLRTRGAQLQPW